MDWLIGKRKKEKESNDEVKVYLDPSSVKEQYLIDVDFEELVQLPYGMDKTEWLATHSISFFQNVNLIWGALEDFCREETKSACKACHFTWTDDKGKVKKYFAHDYMTLCVTWIHRYISDESIFPARHGQEFPSNFDYIIQRIFKLLYDVQAHLYHAHFPLLSHPNIRLHWQLNCLFRHFITFAKDYLLLDSKDTENMDDLIQYIHEAAKEHKNKSLEEDSQSGTSELSRTLQTLALDCSDSNAFPAQVHKSRISATESDHSSVTGSPPKPQSSVVDPQLVTTGRLSNGAL